jgi:hypothetical protein
MLHQAVASLLSAKPLQISVADMSCMAVGNGLQDISEDTLHLATFSWSRTMFIQFHPFSIFP